MLVTHYRPSKIKDSEGGGWTLGAGTQRRLFGEFQYHDNKITFIVRVKEDIQIEDVIGIAPDLTSP